MQLKGNGKGIYTVWVACRPLGTVRKVPHNNARDVLVWGTFLANGERTGMDFRTRKEAATQVCESASKVAVVAG